MNIQVRYYSRSGNTKIVADAIAKGAGTKAVSVDEDSAHLTQKADVLFIGGALYAYGLDKHLKEYLRQLDPAMVGKAVVFSTSWISKHALDLIKNELKAKGIAVENDTFYVKNKATEEQKKEAEEFGRRQAQ